MDPIFCCTQAQPYKAKRLDHDLKFNDFLTWAKAPNSPAIASSQDSQTIFEGGTYVIQIVRQVNYGPLESKRYFVKIPPTLATDNPSFQEITETDLVQANFEKLNS